MSRLRTLLLCLMAGAALPQETRPPGQGDQTGVELDSRLFHEARLFELVDHDQEAAMERYRRITAEPGLRGSLLRTVARVRLAELARDRADPKQLAQLLEDLGSVDAPQRQMLPSRELLQSASWRGFQAAAEEVRAAAGQARNAADAEALAQARQRQVKARNALRAELAEGRRSPLFGPTSGLARLADDLRARAFQRDLGLARPRAVRPLSQIPRKVRDQQMAMFQRLVQGDLDRVRFHQREMERLRRGTGITAALPASPSRDEKAEILGQFVAKLDAGLKAAPGDSPLPQPMRQRVQEDLDRLKLLLEEDDVNQAYQHMVRELWGPLEAAVARALGTRR